MRRNVRDAEGAIEPSQRKPADRDGASTRPSTSARPSRCADSRFAYAFQATPLTVRPDRHSLCHISNNATCRTPSPTRSGRSSSAPRTTSGSWRPRFHYFLAPALRRSVRLHRRALARDPACDPRLRPGLGPLARETTAAERRPGGQPAETPTRRSDDVATGPAIAERPDRPGELLVQQQPRTRGGGPSVLGDGDSRRGRVPAPTGHSCPTPRGGDPTGRHAARKAPPSGSISTPRTSQRALPRPSSGSIGPRPNSMTRSTPWTPSYPFPAGLDEHAVVRAELRECPTPGTTGGLVRRFHRCGACGTRWNQSAEPLVVERTWSGRHLCQPESWTQDQTPELDTLHVQRRHRACSACRPSSAPVEATANPVQFVESSIDFVASAARHRRDQWLPGRRHQQASPGGCSCSTSGTGSDGWRSPPPSVATPSCASSAGAGWLRTTRRSTPSWCRRSPSTSPSDPLPGSGGTIGMTDSPPDEAGVDWAQRDAAVVWHGFTPMDEYARRRADRRRPGRGPRAGRRRRAAATSTPSRRCG